MSLQVRTTMDDIVTICKYLAGKPTGATTSEAKKIIDSKHLDGRKIGALKSWGLVRVESGRMKITPEGREVTKDETKRQYVIRQMLKGIAPYNAIIERAAHKHDESLSATEVAGYWHDYFPEEVSGNEEIINDQAVCFFQLVEGANLGKVIIGRKGAPTRIDLSQTEITNYLGGSVEIESTHEAEHVGGETKKENAKPVSVSLTVADTQANRSNRVFITHGKNIKIVSQLKDIVTFGKFIPIVAEEHETISKPVPEKVLGDMRSCFAGIIHVAGEQVLLDETGKPHHKINENVLIEIGAAMALYGRNFILLVEKGVQLPSNLQGLYECRYEGDNLDGEATMKLLKAFNDFTK